MDIIINVVGQRLVTELCASRVGLVSGTRDFIDIKFNFSDDWDGLTIFAQFSQNGSTYDRYLDENNSVRMPEEIGAGKCTIVLCGTDESTIAITKYITFRIDESSFIKGGFEWTLE